MAKIKIKEGSPLDVTVGPDNGGQVDKATYEDFKKHEKIKIEFEDYHTKYTFKDGVLL